MLPSLAGSSRLSKTAKLVSVAIVLSLVLIGIAVARGLRYRSQLKTQKDSVVERIEQLPTFPLKIQQDDDTPLRILEAKARVISAADYESLTSEKSGLPEVVSAPDVTVLNVSTKTITRIMLVVNDISSNKSKGVMVRTALAPGATYKIVGANFVKQETITTTDESGDPVTFAKARMKSNKFWLPFADKSLLHVRVGAEFQDGTVWFNRDQRSPQNAKNDR